MHDFDFRTYRLEQRNPHQWRVGGRALKDIQLQMVLACPWADSDLLHIDHRWKVTAIEDSFGRTLPTLPAIFNGVLTLEGAMPACLLPGQDLVRSSWIPYEYVNLMERLYRDA